MNQASNAKSAGRSSERLFHFAGVLADGPFANIRRRGIENSFNPKVNGAVHLIMSLGAADAGQCYMFSSASGCFGSPGQAIDAAANASQEHLASRHWQRAEAVYSF